MERRKRRRNKRIAGARSRKPLQCKMKPQIKKCVVILARSPELLGDLQVRLSLGGVRPSGGKYRNEALKLPPRFEHEKLLFDLDFCDPESVATQGDNEMIGDEPLESFAHRAASKSR